MLVGLVQTGVYVRVLVLVGLVQTGVYVRVLVGLVQTGVLESAGAGGFGSDWFMCEMLVLVGLVQTGFM